MYKLTCEIHIGNYIFTQIKNVEIKRSANLLTDTAVVEMPCRFKLENNQRATTEKTFKRGDAVDLLLGYDNNNTVEFTGFVYELAVRDNMVVITCEDSTYLLRRQLTNKAFKTAKLIDVLKYIVADSGLKLSGAVPDVDITGFVIKNVTGLQALEKIKQEYGLTIFVDYSGCLYAGLGMTYNTGSVVYDFARNIIDKDLTFKKAEEIRLKIKAVSILKSNKKIEVEPGATDGELRTLYTTGIESKTQLENWAKTEIEKYKYTGYSGGFTGFLLPNAKYGMSCQLIDQTYPERCGTYYIESVTTTFGTGGARRKIELGVKLL